MKECPRCGRKYSNMIKQCPACSKDLVEIGSIVMPDPNNMNNISSRTGFNSNPNTVSATVSTSDEEKSRYKAEIEKLKAERKEEAARQAQIRLEEQKTRKRHNIFLGIGIAIAFVVVIIWNTATTQSYEYKISKYKSKVNSLERDVDELNTYKSKAEFMDNYIVICYTSDPDYYHKYGCEHVDSDSSFLAYNVNAAANKYTPCPYCIGN